MLQKLRSAPTACVPSAALPTPARARVAMTPSVLSIAQMMSLGPDSGALARSNHRQTNHVVAHDIGRSLGTVVSQRSHGLGAPGARPRLLCCDRSDPDTRVGQIRNELGLVSKISRLRPLQHARPADLESARRVACDRAIKILDEISSPSSTMLWTSKGKCANAHSILSMPPRRRAAVSGPPRARYDRFWPDLVDPARRACSVVDLNRMGVRVPRQTAHS